jgi:hypothetical protein
MIPESELYEANAMENSFAKDRISNFLPNRLFI